MLADDLLRELLERRIAELGLEGRLVLRGYDGRVAERFPEYALFVLTSRMEGMGMVLVEAQLSHLPVVAFDVPCGPSDVIEDGVNGFLIPPFDVEEMAEKIDALISSAALRRIFSDHANLRLHAFEKTHILEEWEQLICEYGF